MPDYSQQLNQARAKELKKKKIKLKSNQSTSKITDVEWIIIGIIAIIADLFGPAGFILVPIILLWYVIRFHRFPTKKFIGTSLIEVASLGFLPGWIGFIIMIAFEEKGYLPNWLSKRLKK